MANTEEKYYPTRYIYLKEASVVILVTRGAESDSWRPFPSCEVIARGPLQTRETTQIPPDLLETMFRGPETKTLYTAYYSSIRTVVWRPLVKEWPSIEPYVNPFISYPFPGAWLADPEVKVEGQLIDPNGKAQGMVFDWHGTVVTVFFPPAQPLQYPFVRLTVPIPFDRAVEIAGQPLRDCLVTRDMTGLITGLRFGVCGIATVPMAETEETRNLLTGQDLPLFPTEMENRLGNRIKRQYDLRRTLNLFLQLTAWAVLVWYQEQPSRNSAITQTWARSVIDDFFDRHTVVETRPQVDSLAYYQFPLTTTSLEPTDISAVFVWLKDQTQGFLSRNTPQAITFYSETFRDKIKHRLYRQLEQLRITIPEPTPLPIPDQIIGQWSDEADFTPRRDNMILISPDTVKTWVEDRDAHAVGPRTALSADDAGLTLPYLYHAPNGTYFLLQNGGEGELGFAKARTIAQRWAYDLINPGFDVEPEVIIIPKTLIYKINTEGQPYVASRDPSGRVDVPSSEALQILQYDSGFAAILGLPM